MVASAQPRSSQALYEQSLRNRLAALLPDSPDWLKDLRLQAFSRFESLGFPTRRVEAWKYINLRPLLNRAFQPQPGLVSSDVEAKIAAHAFVDKQAPVRLVFLNGRFQEVLSSPLDTVTGLTIRSLKTVEEPNGIVSPALETDPFASLNAALFEDGFLFEISENITVEPLIQLLFVTTASASDVAAYLRNIVQVGAHARANFVVEHIGLEHLPFANESVYLNNSIQEFQVAEGAQVECTVILDESANGWHLASTRIQLETDARFNLNTVTLGGQVSRHSVNTLLKGENAEVNLNGLDQLNEQTQVYHHTVTEHWVPKSLSNQFYKGILDQESQSEFNGMVFVAQGANGTDARQLNKNLLLSDQARVFTRPQLQINADDVKCAHGATIGQLDKEQLFYLASRGLNRELARGLLTYGFAEEIIQRISNPAVRTYLDSRILDSLNQTAIGNTALKQQLGV